MPHPTHHQSPASRSVQQLADAPGRLENLSGVLGVALAYWADRADATDKGAARSAANTACDAIDNMLAVLHQARRELVAEVRAHDDATAARVDALLASCRAGAR
jgi:hypothetical protein